VADLVACHMDLDLQEAAPIAPEEVLYYADKLALEDRVVSLEERFRRALERHAQEPVILQKATRRLRTARSIQHRLETAMAKPVAEVLKAL
jgi:hypothetical protein